MARPFRGSFKCPLDAKGRVVLPKQLRDVVDNETLRKEGFVVARSFDGCLVLYTGDRWREVSAKMEEIPFTDPDGRAFVRLFFASAQDVSIDSIGRLALTDYQKQIAGIDREVVFNGTGRDIEAWSPERWAAFDATNAPRYGQVASPFLGGRGPEAAREAAEGAPAVRPPVVG
jgi:MraZ protein